MLLLVFTEPIPLPVFSLSPPTEFVLPPLNGLNTEFKVGFFLELSVFVEVSFNYQTLTLAPVGYWRAIQPIGGFATVQPSLTSASIALSNTNVNTTLTFNVTTQGGSCSGTYYEHTVERSVNGSVAYWAADLFNSISTITSNASFGFTKISDDKIIMDGLAANMGASPSAIINDGSILNICGIDVRSNGTYIDNAATNCLPLNTTTSTDVSCADPGTSAGSQLLCQGAGLVEKWLIKFSSNFAGCN